MRVEIISKNKLLIYINNIFFKNETWDDKDKIIKTIKKYIIRLKNNYHIKLRGFYKVRAFPNKKIGTFIEMEKLDEDDYDSIELRIIVDFKEKLFFKFYEYEYIPNNSNYILYDNFYYVDIKDIEEDIISFIELGEIVYERSIPDMKWKGKKRHKSITI